MHDWPRRWPLPMPLYDAVKDLPLTIERVELEPHALSLKHMTRRTTVVHLHGAGHEGVGEDVSYDGELQLAFTLDALPDFTGDHTVDSFSALADGQPGYRQWGLESAALDLALRQAGRSLAEVVGREPRPVTFVVSQNNPRSGSAWHRSFASSSTRATRGRTSSSRNSPRPEPSTSSISRACTRASGSTRRRRRASTAASPTPFRKRGSRTHASTVRRVPCSSVTGTGSPGTSRSTRSPTWWRSSGRP